MNTTFEQWRSQLPGGLAPPWLADFATRDRPQDALDDLWRRRADLGRLLPMEPEVLLLDWLDRLGKEESFRSRLDEGLAAWIAENWGICKLDAADLRRRSDRWVSALTVVSVAPALECAVAEALRHFGEAHEFLGPMSQSPSSDPLGVFLSIVARHQKNRELAPFWWRMCDLPPEVPYFHAVYAMAGLRGLPPEDPISGGGFRRDVVQGLLRLGESFLRLGRAGVLDPDFAEQEFLRVGRITLAAYPFPKRWRDVLAVELDPEAEVTEILEKLLPGVSAPPSIELIRSTPARIGPDEEWAERANNISRLLKRNPKQASQQAVALLAEQRHYAQSSGDSDFLVRTLRNLASSLRRRDPRRALKWAQEARLWAPHDAYSWNTLGAALLACGRQEDARQIYLQATERFPENDVARNGLAEVLKAQGRLDEAERVYSETVQRFPRDVVSRTGLAEVLKAQERLGEAEKVYSETVQRFPENVVARTGLAGVLKAQGRLEAAERVYSDTVQRFPENVVARTGLAEVLKSQGRLEEAERVYSDTVQRFPEDVVARNGLAEVLKSQGRLEEAEKVYSETVQRFPEDVVARTGLGFVRLELGRLAEAQELFLAVLDQAPGNDFARAGLEKTHEVMLLSSVEWELKMAPPRPAEADAIPFYPSVFDSPAREELVSELREEIQPYDPGSPNIEPLKRETVEFVLTAATPHRLYMPSQERTFRLQQARSLRRLVWALPQGSDEARRLLSRASELLEEVLQAVPADHGGLAEKSLLLLELGRPAEAGTLIEAALMLQPAAPDLLALRAHLARYLPDIDTRSRIDAILFPLRTLEKLYDWATPMAETLAIRLLAKNPDTQQILLDRLQPLYQQVLERRENGIRNKKQVTYPEWIASQLGDSLFAGFSNERPVHQQLPQLQKNLIVRRSHLDELAETVVLQLRASAEPVLPSSFGFA